MYKKNNSKKAPQVGVAFLAENFGKGPILLAETRCE